MATAAAAFAAWAIWGSEPMWPRKALGRRFSRQSDGHCTSTQTFIGNDE